MKPFLLRRHLPPLTSGGDTLLYGSLSRPVFFPDLVPGGDEAVQLLFLVLGEISHRDLPTLSIFVLPPTATSIDGLFPSRFLLYVLPHEEYEFGSDLRGPSPPPLQTIEMPHYCPLGQESLPSTLPFKDPQA